MSDFDEWVRGWQVYDLTVLREKFEAKPSRIERAMTVSPGEHSKFAWEWENAAKAYDLDRLAQIASKWAPRAADLVMSYGKAEA